ncbi:MAG: PepSY domain-containing protein [Parashewanella sp.]
MKPRLRKFWHKWHIYIACFFLPLIFLYTITGLLYLLDIHGDYKSQDEYPVETVLAWPQNEQEAYDFIGQIYDAKQHGDLPEMYYTSRGNHNWYGLVQEITLKPADADGQVTLQVYKHGLLQQLIIIHKGHAGLFFVVLGIILSLGLLFSLLSGVILGLNSPKYKRKSLIAMLVGLVTIIIGFVI